MLPLGCGLPGWAGNQSRRKRKARMLLERFRDDVVTTRFTTLMDDPLLPKLLREFRDALVIEKADRTRIADELSR